MLTFKDGRHWWAEPALVFASTLWGIAPIVVTRFFDIDDVAHALGPELFVNTARALVIAAPFCNFFGVVIAGIRIRLDGRLSWVNWLALAANVLLLAFHLFAVANMFE
jgi:hypothetical protein